MVKYFSVFMLLVAILLSSQAIAWNQSNAKIIFDKDAKRIDLVTGKTVPNYTEAKKGSFQFFNGRLDKPDNFFWYYFDGRRNQNINDLAFIRNMKSIGTWVIATKTDGKSPVPHPNVNCEIEHHAISFIPINPETGKEDPRVYLMIEDIHLIQWEPYNHWLATVSQKEFESMAGKIY